MNTKKTKSFLKATGIALTIATISGIPASPFTSSASAARAMMTLDDNHDVKAVKIIEASIEALGGSEAIESIKFMHQTGTISIAAMGLEGTIETNIASPDRLRIVIDLPMMGKTTQGLNDGVAWSIDAMNGPRILPDEEASDIINQTNLMYPLDFLKNNTTIDYVEETEFDGQAAHKIHTIDTDGKESFNYYAVESGHQIGSEAETDSPMGKIKVITILREYKEIGGQLQPTKLVQMIGPTEILISIDSADSGEIEESVFELPAAVTALIEATAAKEKAAP